MEHERLTFWTPGSSAPLIILTLDSHMGKGDKRSKKGKIFRGSYGKRRPRKVQKVVVKKAAAKKA